MRLLSGLIYYARSLFTLIIGFRQPLRILAIFVGAPHALPFEVELRREPWRFQVREKMDIWIIKETCLDDHYLKGRELSSNWRVVDIGAGLGDFTIYAAHQCSQGLIHAYEPLESSYELLKKNVALNHLHNVEVFPQAVTASGLPVVIAAKPAAAVSTRFGAPSNLVEGGVPSVKLVQVIERLPGQRCDFLKIDCEGCEFALLMDSPIELLAQIDRISMETHEGFDRRSTVELTNYLKKNGFVVHNRPNPVHNYLGFLYAERHGPA